MNRRLFLTGLGAAGAALALPGCANPANQSPTSDPSISAEGSTAPSQVEHRYGTTTVLALRNVS